MSDADGRNTRFDPKLWGIDAEYADVLPLIGAVTVLFQDLEQQISRLMTWLFFGAPLLHPNPFHDATVTILETALPFSKKLDVLSALAIARYGADASRAELVRAFVSRCAEAEGQRNHYIHSWYGGGAGGSRIKTRLDRKKGLRLTFEIGVDRGRMVALCSTLHSLLLEGVELEWELEGGQQLPIVSPDQPT